jgi:hypothetical protein
LVRIKKANPANLRSDLELRRRNSHVSPTLMPLIPKLTEKLQRHPKRVVFAEGADPRIIQAARQWVTRRMGVPILLGDRGIIKAHAAVYGLEVPTKDSVVEVKMRFDGCTMMDVEFDDRKYTGSHYGHLCRAQVRLDKVTIMDEREGSQNEVIKAMKDDPSKKAEVAKMMAGKSATFPVKLKAGETYTVVVETVGDEMRVSIDGKAVAFLKSAGIGHETKSKIEIGVAGQSGWFDDIKVWDASA